MVKQSFVIFTLWIIYFMPVFRFDGLCVSLTPKISPNDWLCKRQRADSWPSGSRISFIFLVFSWRMGLPFPLPLFRRAGSACFVVRENCVVGVEGLGWTPACAGAFAEDVLAASGLIFSEGREKIMRWLSQFYKSESLLLKTVDFGFVAQCSWRDGGASAKLNIYQGSGWSILAWERPNKNYFGIVWKKH